MKAALGASSEDLCDPKLLLLLMLVTRTVGHVINLLLRRRRPDDVVSHRVASCTFAGAGNSRSIRINKLSLLCVPRLFLTLHLLSPCLNFTTRAPG